MQNLYLENALNWFGAIIISVGGTSVIVLALSKWFGDRLANILLEKDKAKYQQELERIKSSYQHELESKKSELDKTKVLFLRYSEHQFTLYNELWRSLCDLRHIGEDLWQSAEIKNLKEFSKQLKSTKLTVEKSALLIEDTHFNDLIQILNQFERFQIGKLTLINLRSKQTQDLERYGVNNQEIDRVVNQNRRTKQDFNLKVNELASLFKRQIKGE